MVDAVLLRRNLELLEDTDHLLRLIKNARVPPELRGYKQRIREVCEATRERIQGNILAGKLGRRELFDDILSNTQLTTQIIRLISTSFMPPLLRAKATDQISLSILNWLHRSHRKTETIPLAVSDGNVAVWQLSPERPIFPTIYFFPSLERLGLLFQPLLFHEFGHVLYAFHKPEMDALVSDLRRDIADLLAPASQRNDRHSAFLAGRRQMIVNVWYSWIQELFCDAVGFTIGGPAFLYAFSTYVSTINRSEYYQNQKDLEKSCHPVAWLRVQFLARRAEVADFPHLANSIRDEWKRFAAMLGIHEDYYGFYDRSLESAIDKTLADMLEEASPLGYSKEDTVAGGWNRNDSPVRLLNLAWRVKQNHIQSYSNWESAQLEDLLS